MSIHIATDDVIDQIDTEDLERELRNRRAKVATSKTDDFDEALDEALHALYRRDLADAQAIIERLRFPKFADATVARETYEKVMRARAA